MPLGANGQQFGYQSPYWSPGQYVPPGTNYANTQWGQGMLEASPETAIYRYMRGLGYSDDQSPFARWLKERYGDIMQGYKAYTVDNPLNANIQGYLNSLGSDWQRQFGMQAPSARGIDMAAWGSGPSRWIS